MRPPWPPKVENYQKKGTFYLLKFMFSKKATKINKVFLVKILSNFEAFLENTNFKTSQNTESTKNF